MAVNLKKGQKIDLTKGNTGLKHILVGLGWDEAEQGAKKGLFGMFKKTESIDCDASAIVCDMNGKFLDIVYYAALRYGDDAIVHHGDNLTGVGVGDDEQITVDLSKLNSGVGKIVFVVNIFNANTKHQHFGMIKNAFIRLEDSDTHNELCRFELSENYDGMEGLIVGEIYNHSGEWKFSAMGQPVQNASRVSDLSQMYK